EYTEVYRELLNASPAYHALAQPKFSAADLASLRAGVVGPRRLLLVYYAGEDQSYLFLLGGRLPAARAFRLTVPKEVAEHYACPEPLSVSEGLALPRGGGPARPRAGAAPPRPAPGPPGTPVPLTREVLRALVENYLRGVADPRFDPSRTL